ncbi:MAG: eukaryotic-like serine/threonine-protein kinase [Solirubrobacteraceae bacterium]|jgi:serine/threonine-protein kinase|nr:eukaryotic-like serine/threonine-protein kinase [Solirubrobacteraceae bacterium]
MRIATDTVIDARYQVINHLGSGGMAEVYCATDLQLGRKVALKILHDRFERDAEFVERFKREASAAAGLQHQHVVSVYDRGEWEGTSYIAMEYVAGRTLKQVIRDEGPLAPARAVDLAVQILRATRFAHRRGVIHRDLKPHNVIVDEEGRAKVTDFGIARQGASDMTQTGSIMGTAQYLSPEQAQGHAVTTRSDLYAVGIVLYEMLTAAVPFEGDSAVTIAVKQVNEAPVAPSHINPEVSAELESVVLCALQKDPAARFADADEFIAALEAAGSRMPSAAAMAAADAAAAALPAVVLAGAPPVGPLTGVYPGLEPPYEPPPDGVVVVPPPRRSRWGWWLLGLSLAALVLIAILLLQAPDRVRVPDVVGSQIAVAQQRLERAGFDVVPVRANSSKPRNEVIGQSPGANTTVDKGSRVTLNISDGPLIGPVPSVVGLGRKAAAKKLVDAGFRVKQEEVFSSDVRINHVISESPSGGSQAEQGSLVTLTISRGPEQATVPDVVGKTEDEAVNAIEGANFTVSVRRRESSSADPGTVLAQDPAGRTQAPSGSRITITVAQAPAPVTVPNVVGSSEAAARKILERRHFKVTVEQTSVTSPDDDGVVQDQSPGAGGNADSGSTVTITVGSFDPNLNPDSPPPPPPPPPPPSPPATTTP